MSRTRLRRNPTPRVPSARGVPAAPGTRRPAPGTRFVLLLAALLALLAACGEPDRSNDYGRVLVPPGQPLLVGVSVALSGDDTGDAQRIERGVRLAVEQAGAVKGHPLTALVRDDGCSAEGSVAVAHAFAALPDVAGVVGPMCSRGCVPASIVYDDAKLLMLTPSCTASVLTGQALDTVVRLAWNGQVAAEGGAQFAAKELRAKRVFAVNDSTFYGKQQRDAFKVTLKEHGGRLIADEYVNAEDEDLAWLVPLIEAARPDLVYYAGFLPAGRHLLQQMRAAGVTAPFMAADGLLDVDGFLRAAGDAAQGVYLTDARPVEGKRYAAFARAYRERWGEDPGPFSAQGYDAAVVLIEAAKKVAKRQSDRLVIDRKALRDAVLATDRQGASGKIQFWPNGERKVAAAPVIKRVDGSRFATVKEYKAE